MNANTNNMDERVYFQPGDKVTLKQHIPHQPVMIVRSIDKVSDGHSAPELLGVTCMWFNVGMELQTSRFNTKDLEHVSRG